MRVITLLFILCSTLATVNSVFICLVSSTGDVYCYSDHVNRVTLSCQTCIKSHTDNVYCVPSDGLHYAGQCRNSTYTGCHFEELVANTLITCDCPYYYDNYACITNPNCYWNGFGCSALPYAKYK